MNKGIRVIKGVVKTVRLEDVAIYTDLMVMYQGKVYNIQRTFGNNTVEIFSLSNTLTVDKSRVYVIVIQDDDLNTYHLSRKELDKILEQSLLGKEVYFTVFNQMVTAETFYNDGTVRFRGDKPYPLLSAMIEFPQPSPPDNSVNMLNEPDMLSFEVFFNKDVIPKGHHCKDCTYYHYLYFPDPALETNRIKVPYCIFLKQGSLPPIIPISEKLSIAASLKQTVDELIDSDSGLLGLDSLWDGVKACTVNTEDEDNDPMNYYR